MRLKITLNDTCNIARAHNGLCLSDTYINISTSLRWKCSKDHEWDAPLGRIKYRNTWCPICVGQHSFHLEIAKKIAIDRGGLCLSIQCTAIKKLLRWRCSRGHEWSVTYNNVIHGKNWCIKCSHRRPCTLEDAIKIAHNKNGECLSKKIINNKSILLWRCSKRHEWNATFNNIKNNKTWCPYCVTNKPCTLEDAKQVTYNRNRLCLSENFINTRLALLWKCVKGHIWYATLNAVKDQNSWCPFCLHKHENLCREIISKYFGPPSKIRRPEFLKTPEHPVGLELDIPYYDYGFAIEVQGEQHEKYNKFFHKGDPNNFI
ncbi:hypothetical protein Glove_505g61 [Diversispora epigaea]|uniref:Zinc-ribbon domain-containing protein n=1 Tax=Diversispora epigaea TaxID=1348612 RepID=A0A397GHY1_9GLOM|nr:hypothetical protein Glove_505g61 [Diversispora epigaea]